VAAFLGHSHWQGSLATGNAPPQEHSSWNEWTSGYYSPPVSGCFVSDVSLGPYKKASATPYLLWKINVRCLPVGRGTVPIPPALVHRPSLSAWLLVASRRLLLLHLSERHGPPNRTASLVHMPRRERQQDHCVEYQCASEGSLSFPGCAVAKCCARRPQRKFPRGAR
jgi:hypothetical protein